MTVLLWFAGMASGADGGAGAPEAPASVEAPPPESGIEGVPGPSPDVLALEVVATAAKRRVVSCPALAAGMAVPSWRRCVQDDVGLRCLAERPAGAETVHAAPPDDGFVELGQPTGVLRWWTEDGQTTCVQEAATPLTFEVEVVDKRDRPVKRATVLGRNVAGSQTDRKGLATLTVWSAAPIELWVVTRGAVQGPVDVAPDSPVPLLAASPKRPRRHERVSAEQTRFTDAFAAQQADLDAALAEPSLPDEVVAVLRDWQRQTGRRWAATAGQ